VIAEVTGSVTGLRLDAVVITVGGVGLLVSATPGTLALLRVGGTARLATSLVVREDSLTLFGFADDESRDTFELLQTVSGVGPRLALAMLAVHDPESLRVAIAAEDFPALMRVPGIGRKGAQRIVLEIGDRLGPPTGGAGPAVAHSARVPVGAEGQVVDALTGLGWSPKQAADAVAAIGNGGGPGASPSADSSGDAAGMLRLALRHLAGS